MKRLIAAALLLISSGFAQADVPAGMAANATPATTRDECFQRLRGHVDLNATKGAFQVLRMIEGYGAETAEGDYQCMARFEVGSPRKADETDWYEAVIFSNPHPDAKL